MSGFLTRLREILFLGAAVTAISVGAWEMAYGSTTETRIFSADSLKIDGLNADVSILPGSGSSFVVRLKGAREHSIQVESSVESGILVLSGGPDDVAMNVTVASTGTGSNTSVVVVNGQRIETSGGQVTVVSGDTSPNRLSVEIEMPLKAALTVRDFSRALVVGNLQGGFDAEISGELIASALKTMRLVTNGNAEAHIACIDGDMNVKLVGNSSVEVGDCAVPSVSVTAGDNAAFRFDGTTAQARVKASGNADVAIHRVIEPAQVSVSGNADVDLGE